MTSTRSWDLLTPPPLFIRKICTIWGILGPLCSDVIYGSPLSRVPAFTRTAPRLAAATASLLPGYNVKQGEGGRGRVPKYKVDGSAAVPALLRDKPERTGHSIDAAMLRALVSVALVKISSPITTYVEFPIPSLVRFCQVLFRQVFIIIFWVVFGSRNFRSRNSLKLSRNISTHGMGNSVLLSGVDFWGRNCVKRARADRRGATCD